jgi:hypothetical protein
MILFTLMFNLIHGSSIVFAPKGVILKKIVCNFFLLTIDYYINTLGTLLIVKYLIFLQI